MFMDLVVVRLGFVPGLMVLGDSLIAYLPFQQISPLKFPDLY